MPLTTHGQHTDEVMGHMTPTQRLILNHLGMLQNPDEDAILGDLNHNLPSAPQRVHSHRNHMMGSAEVRSPFIQDLPPLIESDQEQETPSEQENGEIDYDSSSLNSSASLNHHRLFQRQSLRSTQVEDDAQTDTGSVVVTSIRSSPEVRSASGSQRSNGALNPQAEDESEAHTRGRQAGM